MSNEVLSPLDAIVRQMAARPVIGPVALIQKRFDRASKRMVVMCDVSGSMGDPIGSLVLSKYDHMRIALNDLVTEYPEIIIVAFGSRVARVAQPDLLPEPCGGTNMAGGLALAGTFLPCKTIVISDGLPDYPPSRALEAAQKITGAIDTIYCGPDGYCEAVDFLRSLSRETGGIAATWDGFRTSIADTIRGLLPPPEKP